MGCSAYIVFVLFHKDTALKNAVGDQREIGSISSRNLKPVLNASAQRCPAISCNLYVMQDLCILKQGTMRFDYCSFRPKAEPLWLN